MLRRFSRKRKAKKPVPITETMLAKRLPRPLASIQFENQMEGWAYYGKKGFSGYEPPQKGIPPLDIPTPTKTSHTINILVKQGNAAAMGFLFVDLKFTPFGKVSVIPRKPRRKTYVREEWAEYFDETEKKAVESFKEKLNSLNPLDKWRLFLGK